MLKASPEKPAKVPKDSAKTPDITRGMVKDYKNNWYIGINTCLLGHRRWLYFKKGESHWEAGRSTWKPWKMQQTRSRLLVASSPLIQSNLNKVSSNVILCSNAGLTRGARLYCRSKGLHESQKRMISNAYITFKNDINVSALFGKTSQSDDENTRSMLMCFRPKQFSLKFHVLCVEGPM